MVVKMVVKCQKKQPSAMPFNKQNPLSQNPLSQETLMISPFNQRPIPSHLQTCAWAREPATAAAAQLAAMRLSNDRPARRTAASGQADRIGV